MLTSYVIFSSIAIISSHLISYLRVFCNAGIRENRYGWNHFEAQELDVISKHLSFSDIEKYKVVFEEGEKGNCMCFVANGRLYIRQASGRLADKLAT